MKNKKIIIITSIVTLISTTCIIISEVFSDELLSPEKSKFDERFAHYSTKENYDNEYYLSLTSEKFEIVSEDGYNLYAEYIKNPKETSDKTIYYLHGYGDNRSQGLWFLKTYHDLGYNVVIYDHIGSGDSGGNYSTMGVKESRDLQTVREFIEDRYGVSKIVALHGISMGASTAMYYGEQYGKVDYIIADCGYSTMKGIVKYQYKQRYNLPSFPFMNLANIGLKIKANYTLKDVDCIKSVKSENYKNIKLLIIHGAEDDFTPVEMAYELDNAAIGEHKLEIFEGARHANSYQTNHERYEKLLREIL